MTTQRQELAVREQFNFVPTTLKEAQEYATIFANSGLCPEAYRGRPNDILIVWQMGKELGLDKMQALRTLGCINGMPFAYGDGLLALVKRHPQFEDMHEWFEGDLTKGTLTAYCTIKRKSQESVTQSFGVEDAKRAGLWNKKGPWTLYPRRMLQHRARGFAAKDAFPDALYGLMSEEEAKSVAEVRVATPVLQGKGLQGLEKTLNLAEEDVIEADIQDIQDGQDIEDIEDIKDMKKAEEPTIHDLIHLIKKTNTDGKTINLWLKKAKVSKLEEFNSNQIKQAVDFLKNKDQKNGI